MSNLPVAQNFAQLPAHLQERMAGLQDHFSDVVGASFPPRITTKFQGISVVHNGDIVTQAVNGQMRIVIVEASKNGMNTYFEGAYAPGEDNPTPTCWSSNGKTPDVSVPVAQRQSNLCKGCPRKAENSNRTGRGKACGFKKRLVVATEAMDPATGAMEFDFASPIIFDVNAMSVIGSGKLSHGYNLDNYLKLLLKQATALPPNLLVTVIRRDAGAENAHVLTFEPSIVSTPQGNTVEFLGPEAIDRMMAEFDSGKYTELLTLNNVSHEEESEAAPQLPGAGNAPQLGYAPQPQSQAQPQYAPQPQAQYAPQPQPQPQAQYAPQPQAQPQAQAQPQYAPQPQAQYAPQPQAQVQPQYAPQPQAQAQPQYAPQPQAQPQGVPNVNQPGHSPAHGAGVPQPQGTAQLHGGYPSQHGAVGAQQTQGGYPVQQGTAGTQQNVGTPVQQPHYDPAAAVQQQHQYAQGAGAQPQVGVAQGPGSGYGASSLQQPSEVVDSGAVANVDLSGFTL